MDVRSDTPTDVADTPTEVADSSPSPLVQAPSVDPTLALQHQLEMCQLSLSATLQRTLVEAQSHMREM
eukprot:777536-Prorocentrum_lima.AAC.1